MLMAVMMQPKEKWTDERLDDLNKKVDDGFADTKAVIADTKTEMRKSFEDTKAEMRAGFARVDEDIRTLRRDMLAGFFVIVAAIIGSNAI